MWFRILGGSSNHMSGILGGTGSNPVVAKPEIFHFSYFCNFLYRCSHEDHFVYKFVVPEASFRSELINSIRLYFFLLKNKKKKRKKAVDRSGFTLNFETSLFGGILKENYNDYSDWSVHICFPKYGHS